MNITKNRLNNLSEAEEIKDNEQTGRLRECDLGHGRPIEHGYLLSEASLDYSDLEFSERKYTFSCIAKNGPTLPSRAIF